MRLTPLALSALTAAAFLASACGGAQTPAEPAPAPVPVVEPEPAPAPVQQAQHVYYQVFWRELHVLTVYVDPGPLRSEEPDNPDDHFSGRCSYMSAVSHYFEHEHALADLIAQADSLDEFLDLLRADPDYRVEEAYFEEGY